MPLKTTSLEAVPTIGIDIGKNTFHLIGLDKMGAIVLRQKTRTGWAGWRGADALRGEWLIRRSRLAIAKCLAECQKVTPSNQAERLGLVPRSVSKKSRFGVAAPEPFLDNRR